MGCQGSDRNTASTSEMGRFKKINLIWEIRVITERSVVTLVILRQTQDERNLNIFPFVVGLSNHHLN